MKSLIDLWCNSAEELAEWCHTCTTADIKTVHSRVEQEGFSFLTITLPDFGKEFERALDLGRLDRRDFRWFKASRGSESPSPGAIPVFLQGFVRQVFDVVSGDILAQPSVDCIFAVRQLCYLFSKVDLPCSDSRVRRAMQGYVEIEDELENWESTALVDRKVQGLLTEFFKASQLLFADVFSRVDLMIYEGNIRPQHGPGSTADGRVGNDKFEMLKWTERLEGIFPYGDYALPIWSFQEEVLCHVEFLTPEQEIPVRVISVPKTLRGPRIIAMEPSWMQFMQQGVLRELVRELEDPEELCSSFLGFTDQIPNQEMAREGSRTGLLATLDLKEASDRVPNLLVTLMLRSHPWLLAAVQSTRSSRAEIAELGLCLPKLRKFASMGSALCFPFEAMIFLVIAMIGISKQRGRPLTRSFMKELLGEVRVYGDDIIIPTDSVLAVIGILDSFGFRINSKKSFWRGNFRESCGGDYFDGQDVTPVRLKKPFPTSLHDGSTVKTMAEFRNRLYLRGMWKTTSWLDERITALLRGRFPIVEPTSPCIGRTSFLPYQAERWNDRTHRPEVKAYVLAPRIKGPRTDDVWALVKCLASPVMQDDPRHLERSGRPVAVGTKLRWVTPF